MAKMDPLWVESLLLIQLKIHHSLKKIIKKKDKKFIVFIVESKGEHLFAAYSFCIMLMSDSVRLFWCLLWRTFVELCRAAQSKVSE